MQIKNKKARFCIVALFMLVVLAVVYYIQNDDDDPPNEDEASISVYELFTEILESIPLNG